MVSMPGKRMGYRCFGASLPMRILHHGPGSDRTPPHTRMWRDDRVITAKGSGLRLVSYCVPGSSHRPPPDSRGRSASADGLTTAIRPAEGKKGRLCHVLELDFQCPIQGGACIDPHGFDAGKLIKGKK